MDEFAKLDSRERNQYFQEAANRKGLALAIIEKDFWVCWTLRRLFELEQFKDHLTFKGGTSLSKVYKVIERFSEDIDVSINRVFLGFVGDQDPEKASSKKQSQKLIDKLQAACQQKITGELKPALQVSLDSQLPDSKSWRLESDESDEQTLLFQYPTINEAHQYVLPQVKIELGARSDHFPVENAKIAPYVEEEIPGSISDPECNVRVLSAVRTLWEKATILHSICNRDEHKAIPLRMSRHYYDLFQMFNTQIFEEALKQADLLERVAKHKSIFFKAEWAKYDDALFGTLKLVPPESRIAELKSDYDSMQPMFFEKSPSFDEIMNRLKDAEKQINA